MVKPYPPESTQYKVASYQTFKCTQGTVQRWRHGYISFSIENYVTIFFLTVFIGVIENTEPSIVNIQLGCNVTQITMVVWHILGQPTAQTGPNPIILQHQAPPCGRKICAYFGKVHNWQRAELHRIRIRLLMGSDEVLNFRKLFSQDEQQSDPHANGIIYCIY